MNISVAAVTTVGFLIYLTWLQPPFYFLELTSKYAVDIKTYYWIDSQHKETLHDDPAIPTENWWLKNGIQLGSLLKEVGW